MNEMEKTSFAIIAAVGGARSCYIEAIQRAKAGDFERADALMTEGDQSFLNGHEAHSALIGREAGGDPIVMNLMLTHAEDQLMSAEMFKVVSSELIDVYRHMGTRSSITKGM